MSDRIEQPSATTTWGQTLESPYVHWWQQREAAKSPIPLLEFTYGKETDGLKRIVSIGGTQPLSGQLKIPVPPQALLQDGPPSPKAKKEAEALLSPDVIGEIREETVLIGIVDVGIALGHRRFRDENGKTRFISAWQQSSRAKGQTHLPFGREILPNELNEQLTMHSVDENPQKALDEAAFNRAVGMSEMDHLSGMKGLEYTYAHGTHVLDLAAGFDPLSPLGADGKPDPIKDTRIIAVNLPPMAFHGSAGNFLTAYASMALRHILNVADALWEKQHDGKEGGYPLVLNFSFGQQAGPKDGSKAWEEILFKFAKERNDTKAPTRVVMPVGNQNLSRGFARKWLGDPAEGKRNGGLTPDGEPYTELAVPWRISPGDQTANFLEIWSYNYDDAPTEDVDQQSVDQFEIEITPPGQPMIGPLKFNTSSTYYDLGDAARVYCYQPTEKQPPHFVLCIAPTESWSPKDVVASAGAWNVRVRYLGEVTQQVVMCVQTDLSGTRRSKVGHASYLDHPRYRTHFSNGMLRDSYVAESKFDPVFKAQQSAEIGRDGNADDWGLYGPVQRKGTHNALATRQSVDEEEYLSTIGGFRRSDQRPSIHSSTYNRFYKDDPEDAARDVIWQPTSLYPSDDGVAHYGLLASGARDGSVLASRGTSMSSGLATRHIATALLEAGSRRQAMNAARGVAQAAAVPASPSISNLKIGAGLVDFEPSGRVPRRGKCQHERQRGG